MQTPDSTINSPEPSDNYVTPYPSCYLDKLSEILKELPGSRAYFQQIELLIRIHVAKNRDYSNESFDGLSNFVATAVDTQESVLSVFKFNISQKLNRLKNLEWGQKDPMNESAKDSVLDMANYTILLAAAMQVFGKKLYEKRGLTQ